MNYYEHHLGDWAAATGHLTWDEDMAYTRLLRAYYHAEKAIPEGQQYRLAKATTPAQRKAVDTVLAEFFALVDGHHHQKRADAEIERYKDKQSKAQRSANARWSAQRSHSEGTPKAMRTHSEGNAHQTPDTRHQAPEERESVSSEAVVRAPSGTRLPPDWVLPQEWEEWARNERQDLTPQETAQRFADYWHSKPGAGGRKADWAATWRNWVRNERQPVKAASGETAYQRSIRERVSRMTGGILGATPPGQSAEIIDITEAAYADARALR